MSHETTRPIVVPLDGSLFAETILPEAIRCARSLGAPLDLVLVAMSALETESAAGSPLTPADYLTGVRERLLLTAGLQVVTHVLEGEPVAQLLRHIAEVDAQLVALSTHGRGGLSRFILGSVADRLARAVHCPLLLKRPDHLMPRADPAWTHRLLVPLDGSPVAESIIDPALRVVGGDTTVLILAHVVPLPPVLLPFADGAVSSTAIEAEMQVMGEYLERVAAPYRDRGMTVRTEVRIAEVAATMVLTMAVEQSADYIAVTTSGKGGVPRALFGSVADKVVRAAPGAVILWNPPR